MEGIPSAKMALCEASTDMIGDLPKNVIDNIMKFLPLIDVVRMSVLSKKWRSNWLSVPRLVFDDEFADLIQDKDYNFDAGKWSSVIGNILLRHEGTITEFSLTIPFYAIFIHIDISPWISFVSRNGVKSLTLFNDSNDEPLLRLPTYFFSFVGLENLKLSQCIIGRLPCLTGLRNLLSLELDGIVFEADIFKEFLACCPLLENLVLMCCSIHDPLIIIKMPNLKELYVDGLFQSISFKNASSLLSVSLALKDVHTMEGAADMMKFLASSCKLQELYLCGYACKILANNGVSRILPTTFKALKILHLSWIGINHLNEFLYAFGMIRSCLNMEKLEIWMRVFPDDLNMQELKALADSETNDDLEYRFDRLRSIYISDIRGLALEMHLISYLLAFSPSLGRLSFSCHHTLKAHTELQLYRQMLQFRRASPKAEVLYVNILYLCVMKINLL